MDRRVEGTFVSKEDARREIERLIQEEGYQPKELVLVSDQNTSIDETTIDEVKVDIVDSTKNGSVWEKVKETLSFGTYHSEEAENALEKHGVTHDLADHYIEALKSGELVLLANSDAPANPELSELNETIIEEEENVTMVDKKQQQDAPVDEVNSEEEEALKGSNLEKNPSDVSTSETKDENVEEGMDPSQANETRSDDSGDGESDLDDDSTTEDDGTDPSTNPDLTGEEDTVSAEETQQKEPKTAKGQVKPEAKSPLNAEPKSEKDPSEESESPEGDAEYPEEQEKAGMKNEEDNE